MTPLSWKQTFIFFESFNGLVGKHPRVADVLPLTLPQLSDRNYQRAITTLMTQLDARLEAALIKSAMPNRPQTTRTITDIIQRLTALPQYQQIGSGASPRRVQTKRHVRQTWRGKAARLRC